MTLAMEGAASFISMKNGARHEGFPNGLHRVGAGASLVGFGELHKISTRLFSCKNAHFSGVRPR